MNNPIFTISIESNGDLLLRNNQDLFQIPTQDIHYLYMTKQNETENNIYHLKAELFSFQIVKNHEKMASFKDYFDLIEQDNYEICTLKVNLDCVLETNLDNYSNLPKSTYEKFICVKNDTKDLWFINLDYVQDITVEPDITVHPFNHLFRFKKIQESFVYEPSLLNKLKEYLVQVTIDNQVFYISNIQEFNMLLQNQIKQSRHIRKSKNTLKNLTMIQERVDDLVKLDEYKVF
jgi:hypothetical protein